MTDWPAQCVTSCIASTTSAIWASVRLAKSLLSFVAAAIIALASSDLKYTTFLYTRADASAEMPWRRWISALAEAGDIALMGVDTPSVICFRATVTVVLCA